jgi:endonuclease YncB( thermonuclease family)
MAMEFRNIRASITIAIRIALLFALVIASASADILSGKVIGVSDGDTITLLDSNRQQHRIRLAGIDAPEKAQPFGQRSKQALIRAGFREGRKS